MMHSGNDSFARRLTDARSALEYLRDELNWQLKCGFVNTYRDPDVSVTNQLSATFDTSEGDPKTEQRIVAACKALKNVTDRKLESWELTSKP